MKKTNCATGTMLTTPAGRAYAPAMDIHSLGNYYSPSISDGAAGADYETVVRYCMTGIISRVHKAGIADIAVKSGVTVECKTGCGWLTAPDWSDEDRALEALYSGQWRMSRASHVCYLPRYNGPESVADAIVLRQADFIRIFSEAGKIRVKKHSAGGWGIAIQSYIPTPTFKASPRKFQSIIDAMMDAGEYIDTFCARMGVEVHDIPGVIEW